MKTGVYQTNLSYPGKATQGGWDILFSEGESQKECDQRYVENWELWAYDTQDDERRVWIRPVGVRQPWIDNGDGTFSLSNPEDAPPLHPPHHLQDECSDQTLLD